MAIVAPVLGFTPKSHTHSLTHSPSDYSSNISRDLTEIPVQDRQDQVSSDSDFRNQNHSNVSNQGDSTSNELSEPSAGESS